MSTDRDLFAGRLGFRLMRGFEVSPSLFGVPIDDDAAEMTFALFDHPDVFVFERTAAAGSSPPPAVPGRGAAGAETGDIAD